MTIRKILRPEQVKVLVAEITAELKKSLATPFEIVEIEQFYALHDEVFLVRIEQEVERAGIVRIVSHTWLMWKQGDVWQLVPSFTLSAPTFTHSAQQ